MYFQTTNQKDMRHSEVLVVSKPVYKNRLLRLKKQNHTSSLTLVSSNSTNHTTNLQTFLIFSSLLKLYFSDIFDEFSWQYLDTKKENLYRVLFFLNGRDDTIWTCDPLVPSEVRYQATPHPVTADKFKCIIKIFYSQVLFLYFFRNLLNLNIYSFRQLS